MSDKKTQLINNKLYDKLSKEYDEFYNHLLTLSPKEIVEKSYEKVFKEDFLLCFEERNLDYKSAKALLNLKNPLDELYQEWLSKDYSYMDMLRDVIDERCVLAIKDQKNLRKGVR